MGLKSFGVKMVIIAAIFMLPITLLIVLLHLQIHSNVDSYEQELLGVNYTRALRPLFSELEAQRSAPAGRRLSAAAAQRVDAAFYHVFRTAGAAGERLALTRSLLSLQEKWRVEGASDGVLDAFVALLGSVSDKSKITLDQTLDGYYVSNIMVNRVPSLIEAVARAGAINRDTGFGRYFADDDRIGLTILSGQIAAARDGIDHDLAIAVATAPALAVSIDRFRPPADDASSAAIEWLDEMMLLAKMPLGDAADWSAHEQRCLDSAFALYDASISGLDNVLKKRIDTVIRREVTIFAAVFGAITVAFGLMCVTALSMSRHLADKAALKREVAERTEVEKQLAHTAYHDKLTGVSNRAWLMDRMREIAGTASVGTRPWAILFLDLDRFKVVNDSLGHVAGDSVLVQATRRFERCIRSCDTLARLGGDEFIILVDEVQDVDIVKDVAQRVLRTFDTPFAIADREVFISASIGIALGTNGDDRPEDVLRNADIAMYRAKALGKSRYEMFTPDLLTSAVTRLEVDTDLARALDRQEFRLFYQPIVALDDGRLTGFEALVRWQHPVHGLVGPDDFIRVAEENGAIVAIGEWILRQACAQLRAWRIVFPDQQLRMNVNVSAKQLIEANFAQIMESAFAESGVDPHCVNMEITESILMENADHARSMLAQIKRLGVHIHLDDFGTGYSSLAYLRDFPIDALKIDKSFVSRRDDDDFGSYLASVEIVGAIIALAQSLSLTVTAEGVETDRQRSGLRALGCTRAQGYYFSRPMEASAAGAYIAEHADKGENLAGRADEMQPLPLHALSAVERS